MAAALIVCFRLSASHHFSLGPPPYGRIAVLGPHESEIVFADCYFIDAVEFEADLAHESRLSDAVVLTWIKSAEAEGREDVHVQYDTHSVLDMVIRGGERDLRRFVANGAIRVSAPPYPGVDPLLREFVLLVTIRQRERFSGSVLIASVLSGQATKSWYADLWLYGYVSMIADVIVFGLLLWISIALIRRISLALNRKKRQPEATT